MRSWLTWLSAHFKSVLIERRHTLNHWSKQEIDRGHVPSFENWLRTELVAAVLSSADGSQVNRIRTDGRLLKKPETGDQETVGPVRLFSSKEAAEHVDTGKSFQSPDISVAVTIGSESYVVDVEIKTQFDAANIVGDLKYVAFHNNRQDQEPSGKNYNACFLWCFVNPSKQRDDFAAAEAVKKRVNREMPGLDFNYFCLDVAPWIGYAIAAPRGEV